MNIFEVHNNEFKVVSLDGHRISIRKIELKDSYPDRKVIVPGKSLQEVSKIFIWRKLKMKCVFSLPEIISYLNLTIRLLFPVLLRESILRLTRCFPVIMRQKFVINKKEMLSCIDRATLLVKEGDKKPIVFRITDENMEISINSQLGSMKEDIDIQKEGKDILIGFNPKFLIDALRVIDDEEVTIYMVNPKAPCYIRDEEEKYVYLILPVNFNASAN